MSAKEQTDTPTPRSDLIRDEWAGDPSSMGYTEALEALALDVEAKLTSLQADVRRLVDGIHKMPDVADMSTKDFASNVIGWRWGILQPALDSLEANNPSLKPE